VQIVNCKDELAQYYLMDCIIQVFPDEYHLQTLETLLSACPQLQVGNMTSWILFPVSGLHRENNPIIPNGTHPTPHGLASCHAAHVINALRPRRSIQGQLAA
jgi:hypothetical protein